MVSGTSFLKAESCCLGVLSPQALPGCVPEAEHLSLGGGASPEPAGAAPRPLRTRSEDCSQGGEPAFTLHCQRHPAWPLVTTPPPPPALGQAKSCGYCNPSDVRGLLVMSQHDALGTRVPVSFCRNTGRKGTRLQSTLRQSNPQKQPPARKGGSTYPPEALRGSGRTPSCPLLVPPPHTLRGARVPWEFSEDGALPRLLCLLALGTG